jgi:hypothetical protein
VYASFEAIAHFEAISAQDRFQGLVFEAGQSLSITSPFAPKTFLSTRHSILEHRLLIRT